MSAKQKTTTVATKTYRGGSRRGTATRKPRTSSRTSSRHHGYTSKPKRSR